MKENKDEYRIILDYLDEHIMRNVQLKLSELERRLDELKIPECITKDEIIQLIDERIPEKEIKVLQQPQSDDNFIPSKGFTIPQQIIRTKRGLRNK